MVLLKGLMQISILTGNRELHPIYSRGALFLWPLSYENNYIDEAYIHQQGRSFKAPALLKSRVIGLRITFRRCCRKL